MHITTDNAITWMAEKLLDRDAQMVRWRENNQILPVTKYNLLLGGLNASTVLLTIAVAAAAFFAVNAALVFGTIGFVIRAVAIRELSHYTVQGAVAQAVRNVFAPLLPERVVNVIHAQGTPALIFDEWVLWMNPAPVPQAPR